MDCTLDDLELSEAGWLRTGGVGLRRMNSISELEGVRLALGIPDSATDFNPWMELEDLRLDRPPLTTLLLLLVLLVATVPRWKGWSRPCRDDDLSLRAEVLVWCITGVPDDVGLRGVLFCSSPLLQLLPLLNVDDLGDVLEGGVTRGGLSPVVVFGLALG